jgi:hypothetical protein
MPVPVTVATGLYSNACGTRESRNTKVKRLRAAGADRTLDIEALPNLEELLGEEASS